MSPHSELTYSQRHAQALSTERLQRRLATCEITALGRFRVDGAAVRAGQRYRIELDAAIELERRGKARIVAGTARPERS